MRIALAASLILAVFAAGAQDKAHGTATAAASMRAAAEGLLAALPKSLHARALRPFDDPDRLDWHYTPRSRNGLSLKDLDAKGRDAVHTLLRAALSASGHRKIVNIIELEIVLRDLETFGLMRDPEKYHLTVYGEPHRTSAWGWRFEGHHLSFNFTLAGDRLAVDTPSFLGANPATVPKGPKKGLRVLAEEEDEARALLASLGKTAVFDSRSFGEIVTRNEARVDPLEPVGVPAGRMTAAQRAQLLKLIEVYAKTFEPGLAAARIARVREGGIDTIRFGWAGSTERGRPHYYRVQGPLFLIEYDCSQNDGNHIHTVWRDFRDDFGRDLLREHYAAVRGTGHRH